MRMARCKVGSWWCAVIAILYSVCGSDIQLLPLSHNALFMYWANVWKHTHTHVCTGLLTAGRWRTFFLIFFSFRAFFFRLYIFSKCAFVAERNNVIRLIVGVSQYLWCYYCSWLSFNARKMGFLTVDVCVHACVRVCVCVCMYVNVCLREQIRKRKIERRRRRGLKLP